MGQGQRSLGSGSKVTWIKVRLRLAILAGGLTSMSSCIFFYKYTRFIYRAGKFLIFIAARINKIINKLTNKGNKHFHFHNKHFQRCQLSKLIINDTLYTFRNNSCSILRLLRKGAFLSLYGILILPVFQALKINFCNCQI